MLMYVYSSKQHNLAWHIWILQICLTSFNIRGNDCRSKEQAKFLLCKETAHSQALVLQVVPGGLVIVILRNRVRSEP